MSTEKESVFPNKLSVTHLFYRFTKELSKSDRLLTDFLCCLAILMYSKIRVSRCMLETKLYII